MRGFLLTICVALVLFAAVAWATGLYRLHSSGVTDPRTKTDAKGKPVVDMGPRLFQGEFVNIDPPVNPGKEDDLGILPECNLSVIDKLDVTSHVDGTLLFFGKQLEDKEIPGPNEKIYKAKIYQDGKEKFIRYRRLHENDFVDTDE